MTAARWLCVGVGCGTLRIVPTLPAASVVARSVRAARRTFGWAATTLLVSIFLGGCGDRKSNRVEVTDSLGCSTSYVAKSTEVLGVEEMGTCEFRGSEISIVTFRDNASRNNYVCATCGYNVTTEAGEIESTARRLGGRFVAGDRYLVQVPDWVSEQGAREALG